LSRIISLIQAYQRQADSSRDLSKDSALNAYLKQHLSSQDWAFWQQIQNLDL